MSRLLGPPALSLSVALSVTLSVALTGRPALAHPQTRVATGARPDTIGPARRLGVIEGVVTDSSLAPIPSAEVAVVSRGISVRTGPNGRFFLPGLSQGSHILIVRRIGFFPASMILRLAEADTLRVAFTLAHASLEIEAVTVMGDRGQALRLMEFEYRRRFGFGKYMGRRDIDKHRGARTADLVKLLGMPLTPVPGDDGQVKWYVGTSRGVPGTPAPGAASASAATLAQCEGRVFLNGVALPAPVDSDDLPTPRELAGIEVYRGVPPPIPLEYGGMSACGVVVMLWTTEG
jgi:hypothetical protein